MTVNPFGPQPGALYVLVKTKRRGKLIRLMNQVVNPEHPRVGDWVWRNENAGQRRCTGIITTAELERNWKWVQDL